jgi:hypothetical protein
MIVATVLLRGSPMSFRGLLMLLGSLLVHIPSPDYAEGREILRRLWQETSDSRSKSLSKQVASRISPAPQPP